MALALAAALTLLVPAAASAARGGMKWIGLGQDMRVEGAYGRGTRWGKAGNQFLVRFEGGLFGKASPLGNLAGLEFGMLLGYDSAPFEASDGLLGEMSMLPMEVSVGFPLTLFNWVKGRNSLLMIAVAPGFGVNWLSAFTYLRLKAAGRVGPAVVAEVEWLWWPGAASYPFGTGEERAINAASLRGTVYFGAARKGAFLAFAELYASQREWTVYNDGQSEKGGNADKTLFGGRDVFGRTARVGFEDFFRLGVGYAF